MTSSNENRPAWLDDQIKLRTVGIVVRSETPAEFAARIEATKGEKWDSATQKWVKVN
jgi:hypothetical protein